MPAGAVATDGRSNSKSSSKHVDRSLQEACSGARLRIAFQPMFGLNDGDVYGYEALMRPPTPWAGPLDLIDAARAAGLSIQLETACCELAIQEFLRLRLSGRLFLNLSASAMVASGSTQNHLLDFAVSSGLAPSRIVIELTEREPIPDLDCVIRTMRSLRDCGLGVALDDFGQGYSGLRLWLELRPDIVKIDQFFVSGLQKSSDKFQALKSLVQLADNLDTALVAEGIETDAELTVLRDLGISLGQGYLLGRPAFDPPHTVSEAARTILKSRQIAVFPERSHVQAPSQTVGQLLSPMAPVARATTNFEVERLFEQAEHSHALAVTEGGVPIGIINRQRFIDQLNKPFHREIYGRRSCAAFMNTRPLVVEADSPIESLMQVLSGEDQRYLADGFVIVANGRYLGLGTGESLVRAVSALRIEAARHANPLTFLPGNIPITEHIARLLASGAQFVAAYADLDQFKPFNDQYGYFRGDEMIKLQSRTLVEYIDPIFDFVGHVGGDDFVVLFQSPDWERRCEAIVTAFREAAYYLYNATDRERGGLHAEDRHGNSTFYRLTTMSIGVVEVLPGVFRTPESVASCAAAAKRLAKRSGNCVKRFSDMEAEGIAGIARRPDDRAPAAG